MWSAEAVYCIVKSSINSFDHVISISFYCDKSISDNRFDYTSMARQTISTVFLEILIANLRPIIKPSLLGIVFCPTYARCPIRSRKTQNTFCLSFSENSPETPCNKACAPFIALLIIIPKTCLSKLLLEHCIVAFAGVSFETVQIFVAGLLLVADVLERQLNYLLCCNLHKSQILRFN